MSNQLKNYTLASLVANLYFKKSIYYINQEEYRRSLKNLNCALKIDPLNEDFSALKGIIIGLFLGKTKVAIESIEKALELNPASNLLISVKKELIELRFKNFASHMFV